jgi:hypothetical protein
MIMTFKLLNFVRFVTFVVSEQGRVISLLLLASAFLLDHQRIELGFQGGI